MTATVIQFPKTYSPPPRKILKISDPKLGAGQALITIQGESAARPETWDEAFRLIIHIRPQFVDGEFRPAAESDVCHRALSNLANDFSYSCFGGEFNILLPMIAVLEGSSNTGRFYTILFEVPPFANAEELLMLAYRNFEELIDDSDDVLPPIVVSEIEGGSVEASHLLGRTALSGGNLASK